MRARHKRGTARLRHADTDPYPLRLLSIGDIGSRTRRRRLTGKRTLSMCRSSYQPLRSGSASEAILCSGMVRRGLGRRACARTHESGRAPRRRLAPGPQPGPPCPTTTALRPLRRRPAPTSFASVGCSLAPSPTAPSPFASSRAKRSRLRHRRPPPRFPAPPPVEPPGGRLSLAPGLTRDPAQSRRAPARSSDHLGGRCSARAPLPPPPPLRPFPSVCLVCKSVLSVTCGVVVPSRGRVRSLLTPVACRLGRLSPCARGDRTCNSGRPAHF